MVESHLTAIGCIGRMLCRPSNHGRAPGLKRKPPGLLASAAAVQRKMRRHC